MEFRFGEPPKPKPAGQGKEPEPEKFVFILQLMQFGDRTTRILHAAIDQPGAEVLQALCGFRARRSAIRLGLTVQPVNCTRCLGLLAQREAARKEAERKKK